MAKLMRIIEQHEIQKTNTDTRRNGIGLRKDLYRKLPGTAWFA